MSENQNILPDQVKIDDQIEKIRLQLTEYILSNINNIIKNIDNIVQPQLKHKAYMELIPYVLPKLSAVKYEGDVIEKLSDEAMEQFYNYLKDKQKPTQLKLNI